METDAIASFAIAVVDSPVLQSNALFSVQWDPPCECHLLHHYLCYWWFYSVFHHFGFTLLCSSVLYSIENASKWTDSQLSHQSRFWSTIVVYEHQVTVKAWNVLVFFAIASPVHSIITSWKRTNQSPSNHYRLFCHFWILISGSHSQCCYWSRFANSPTPLLHLDQLLW